MSAPVGTVLLVSRDQRLVKVQKDALEKAGFPVITATDMRAVEAACKGQRIRLAVIGYSLPPSEKRRVANAVRQFCDVPVLELYQGESPALSPTAASHRVESPEDFIEAVKEVLRRAA